MQRQSGWHIKRRVLFLGAGVIVVSFLLAYLVVFIFAPSFFEPWQNKITDGFFKLRNALTGRGEISPYIIHAVLNDTSYHTLESIYGDNNFYSRILYTISEAGVRAIACDIFFSKESKFTDNSLLFEQANQRVNIYFPVILYPDNYTIGFDMDTHGKENESFVEKNLWYPKVLNKGKPLKARMIITPIPKLLEHAKGLGHITCDPDSDGINRRFPLLYKYKDGYFPALVLRMLSDILNVAPSDIEVSFGNYIRLPNAQCGEFVKKDIIIPVDRKGRMVINFAGSWNDSFIHFPIHNLLKVETDPDLKLQLYDDFEGSFVIFSDTSTRNKDYGPGIFDRVYPLSGLHLNIANTILTQNFIHEPGFGIHLIISLILALILWVLSFSFRPAGFLISCFCLILFSIFLFTWLFIGFRVMTVIPHNILGVGFAIVLICFYRFIIEDQEKKILTAKALAATKLKELNRGLNKANKTLKEIEQYREHFVQNITHEFRTPLTLILSPLEILLEDNEKKIEPEVLKMLSIIKQGSQKLLYLIDQLLDLSKIKSGKMNLTIERCDIVNLLFSLVHYFIPLAKTRGIQLQFKKKMNTLFVPVDQEKIEIVISNLISNALKFSKAGDKVIVECSAPVFPENLQVEWPYKKPKEVVKMSVKDTGPGIPEKELSVIFERFKQGEWPFYKGVTGSGIGLALVREYVSLHQGIVTVKSKPGKGTTFDIFLPVPDKVFTGDEYYDSKTHQKQTVLTDRFKEHAGLLFSNLTNRSSPSDRAVGMNGKLNNKILIVDDDEQMRVYLRFVLSHRYRVHEAVNGEEGFKKACDLKPDLIITDLIMPRMDGLAFIKTLKEHDSTSRIPVLLITARMGDDSMKKAQTVLPDDFLVKPFNPRELDVRISNLLNLHYFKKTHIHPQDDKSQDITVDRQTGILYPGNPVLLVDDEKPVLEAQKAACEIYGITNVILCDDARKVMPLLTKNPVSCIILDLSMPHVSGIDLLEKVKLHYPEIPVIVVTGISAITTAVECMRYGAYDYLVKPVGKERLASVIRHSLEQRALVEECSRLRTSLTSSNLEHPEAFSHIITRNASMLKIFKIIESFACGNHPVLICGESGVGKELIAEAIHCTSNCLGKFIVENIAGLDATIFSDTLFGHVKGAYTGAITQRKGLVEKAAGGTLFLDEIGELDPESQVKLLRFLEYREYRPLGYDNVKLSDARIIAATNVDLEKKIEAGNFRKDLYYRLSQKVTIPPLRERLDDIPLLLDYFLEKYVNVYAKEKPEIDSEVITLLQSYHYPGNIREFAAMVDRAVSLQTSHVLETAFFRDYIRQHGTRQLISIKKTTHPVRLITYSGEFPSLAEVEYFFIQEAMKKAKGNQRLASRLLGLSTSALNRRLRKRKME